MTIHVRDISRDFVEWARGTSDLREVWARYERAHPDLFATYFSNPYRGRRDDLDSALARFPAALPRIRALGARAPSTALHAGEAVTGLLRAGEVEVACVLFVGLFGANGFQDSMGDVPAAFVALERVPDDTILGLLLAHELAHAVHERLRAGDWIDRDPLLAVFAEGLAVHLSQRAVPGQELTEYLWMRSPLAVPAHRYLDCIAAGAAELVGARRSTSIYERFFNYDAARPPAGLPPRFGYFIGERVLRILIGAHSLETLARWPAERAAAATESALRELVAGA